MGLYPPSNQMQVIESISEMQEVVAKRRSRRRGKTIALVPTMGHLHPGHLSLVKLAKKKADTVILSLFVNPTQFGINEDFNKYPRNRQRDLELCKEHGVDIVFAPLVKKIFPPGYSTYIKEDRLSAGLCGVSRPVLFRGVCTIVIKLLNIMRPDILFLGRKDAQQAAVVKKMVSDLHIPVRVLMGTTIREKSGLAISSRNIYLNETQKRDATIIYQALAKARNMVKEGIINVDRIKAEVNHILSSVRRIRIIYVDIVEKDSMEPLREIVPRRSLITVAVWCDEVRLIDNVVV